MLSKFSVKKPMTVVVAVILVILLGVISFINLKTDLMPAMDLPYVVVMTTAPGASPERVEQTVTKPLEQVLATASGLENMTSISSENSSMIILEFDYAVNMDSTMIELNGSIDMVKGFFDDTVSAPTLMKINPEMMPVLVASVDVEGMDIIQTTEFVNDSVIPALERISGVASVSAMGQATKSIQVSLDQQAIDDLNDRVLASIDQTLLETQQELEDAQRELDDAQRKLDRESKSQTQKLLDNQAAMEEGKRGLAEGIAAIDAAKAEAQVKLAELEVQIAALTALSEPAPEDLAMLAQLEMGLEMGKQGLEEIAAKRAELVAQLERLEAGASQLETGKLMLIQELAKADLQISNGQAQLDQGLEQFETAKEEAYKSAGLDGMITPAVISSMLMAENFSMPVGSITDGGQEYLVKVGEKFSGIEELQNLELFTIDAGDIGVVRLCDIAKVEFTDDAGQNYAKINGNPAVLLTAQKQSTVSTAQVSSDIRARMNELESQYGDLNLTVIQDQGVYIDLVVGSVTDNLLMGGALAILILWLFLASARPTLIIACSIPISLTFAIVLMYFAGMTLNVLSLAGLALGVGMLVDNSIVCIENIYRLRFEGMEPKKAAIAGAKEISGALVSSTLTTVCVFLPIVFTEGLSRQLFTDMGLTIAFSLIASLIVALTLVPAMAQSVLRKTKFKENTRFDRFAAGYSKCLGWVLKRKWIVLVPSVLLLAWCAFYVSQTGIIMLPSTDSQQIMATVALEEGSGEDLREMTDVVSARIAGIEGVEAAGAMEQGESMTLYVVLKEDRALSSDQISALIERTADDLECTVSASGSGMDMSMLTGSGMEIAVSGDDLDTLMATAADVAAMLNGIEGFENVDDGSADGSAETRVTVDKNAALAYGLTVAQVYQAVSDEIKTEYSSTTITLDGYDYEVIIVDSAEMDNALLGDIAIEGTREGEKVEVPLKDIAAIQPGIGPGSIKHDNQSRTITVRADVADGYNITLLGRQVEDALGDMELAKGYFAQIEGENQVIAQSMNDLVLMIVLAAALVYLIMVATFQSLLFPFVVILTIPLAFTGGVLGLMATGLELSVIAMLGFLVLAGVVVNNGIVFVDCVNRLRLQGMERSQALLEAGRLRLRPILMTTMTTVLALVTLALGMGSGADMLQPMAVVTIGGLTYATILTLFIVPSMYDIMGKRPLRGEMDE